MDSDCKMVFFIDADLSWEPKAFVRLVESDEPVIGGVYPAKQTPKKFMTKGWERDDDDRYVTRGLPGGFIRIRRHVIEKMQEAYPELKATHRGRDIYMLWNELIVDGAPLGEDFSFCHRWNEIGGECVIDPDIQFCHYGTMAYRGHFGREVMDTIKTTSIPEINVEFGNLYDRQTQET